MGRTPEALKGDTYMRCLRCQQEILDVRFVVIDNQRVYADARALDNCTTPCLNQPIHLAPVEKYLILPRTPQDQAIIDIRLENPKS